MFLTNFIVDISIDKVIIDQKFKIIFDLVYYIIN